LPRRISRVAVDAVVRAAGREHAAVGRPSSASSGAAVVKLELFISWSGEKSRRVALALADWLPSVINDVEPFVSAENIHAGARWQTVIGERLEKANFGIICVTAENQSSPWLNFEAGALAKALDQGRVIPLALDLKLSDIENPLAQFQGQLATREGIGKILESINEACDPGLTAQRLEKALARWWPELEESLRAIDDESAPAGLEEPTRDVRALVEEVLDIVRSLSRSPKERPGRLRASTPPGSEELAREISQILATYGASEYTFGLSRGGTAALQVGGPAGMPAEVRGAISEAAERYGVEVEFTGPVRKIGISRQPHAN